MHVLATITTTICKADTVTNPFALGTNYRFTDDGHIVSAKHQRIAEIIQDYNPELSLMWIPPDKRSEEDAKPFAVVHTKSDGSQYALFYLREEDLNEDVLAAIFYMDMSKHSPRSLELELEAQERARQIYEAKEREERMGEKREFAKFMLKTPLHTFKHNGKKYRS